MKEYQIVMDMLDGTSKKTEIFNSYKDAMQKYNEIKKSKMDSIHMIKFNKIENDDTTALFTKKVQEKKMYLSCREIAKNVDEMLELLDQLKVHHTNIIKIAERKRETLIHLIRGVGNKQYQDKNEESLIKLNLFDELALWENKRKNSKNELEDIFEFQKSSSNLSIDALLKDRGKIKLNTESVSVTRNKYERVITYENVKEKEMYLKQNKNYAYYIVDDYTRSIYFYNKFDNQKSQKEFKKALHVTDVVKLAVKDINNTNINEKVCENKSTETELKVLEYKSIKQRSHYVRQYHKIKYKYYKWNDSSQKLYFSNNPIDIDMLV